MCKLIPTFVLFWSFHNSCIATHNICNFDVALEQFLTHEGFHRNITYEVTFGNYNGPHLYESCIIGLDQSLPPGVYTNSDELQDLGRINKLNAIPKTRVNVELPAEQAQPSSVYIIGKLRNSAARLWLPVHGRYHAARRNGGYANNEIPPPKLFIRCPDNRLQTCDSINSITTFQCTHNSKKKCVWKRIPHNVLTSPLIFVVPVGNTSDHPLVGGVTVTVVIAGSLYLLKTLHEYKIAGRKKRA